MINKDFKKEIGWLLKEKYPAKFADAHRGVNYLTKKIKKDLERLEKGEPLDYIIGFTEFLGCKINLSKKPLIPRKETEFWTEQAIAQIKTDISVYAKITRSRNFCTIDSRELRVLDMFSGSGCIGVAVLKHIPNSLCDFADIDKENLKQIKINLKLNRIKENRCKIIQSNILKNIKETYDYIFANPPYIATGNKNKIQKSVLDFEPKVALFGGKDGLFYIRRFLKEVKNHLRPAGSGYPNGKIYMEFDYIQKKEIEKLFKRLGYKKYQFFKDQYKRWRWVKIINY